MAIARRRLTLRLRPIRMAEATDLVNGRAAPNGVAWHPEYPLAETIDALNLLFAAYQATGVPLVETPLWWIQQIVVDGEVVGDAGFHGPIADGTVEIGYAVVPGCRGRGIGTGACRALIQYAWRAGARRLVAEVDPDNEASRRVLLGNGFVSVGDGRFELEQAES